MSKKKVFFFVFCSLFFIFITSCEKAKVLYERAIRTQDDMLESYRNQKASGFRNVVNIKTVTLNTYLLNFFLIRNKDYHDNIKLFENMLEDGRFLEEVSQGGKKPDFIALQEFFKQKDLRGILDRASKIGYVSVFDLFKKQNPDSKYKREKIGLDIWVREDWLKTKVLGEDYEVGFTEYKNERGVPIRHILEALGGYRRGVLWIDLKINKRRRVLATSTHLTPLKLTSWADKRLKQAEFLKQWVLKQDSDFVVLSGDMNSASYFVRNEEENPDYFGKSTRSYTQLIEKGEDRRLYDSFHVLYPEELGFTMDPLYNLKRRVFSALNLKSFDPEHVRKVRQQFPDESLEESIKEYNEYVKNKSDSEDPKTNIFDNVRERIDYHFFLGTKDIFVDVTESDVLFKEPFELRQGQKPLFFSDHYGLVSQVSFWY